MRFNHEHAWEEPPSLLIFDSPKFANSCGHPTNTFVGCFYIFSTPYSFGDVYLYDDTRKQSVCIRVGNEPGDYVTPGTALDLFIRAASPDASDLHRAAAAVLDKRMDVRLTPKEP